MLAARLEFAVGEPLLVDLPVGAEDLVRPISPRTAARMRNAAVPAFGSRFLGEAFRLWQPSPQAIEPAMRQTAADIWAFDQLIMNPDRNERKPNCLSDGVGIAVIDHEKALNCHGVGGFIPAVWQDEWKPDQAHIFHETVITDRPDFSTLEARWNDLAQSEFAQMLQCVPQSWHVDGITDQIGNYFEALASNLKPAFANLRKVTS